MTVLRRGWGHVRSTPRELVLLLLVTALLGVAWTVSIAPVSGPDESAHASYAQHLAETGAGPQKESGEAVTSRQYGELFDGLGLKSMLGHTDGKPDWTFATEVNAQASNATAAERSSGSGPNAVANNPPLYYAYAAVVYHLSPDRSALGRLGWMRLATVLFTLITVLCTWLLAAEMFAASWPRLVAAGTVALQPKLSATGAIVNPDAMLVAVSTAFILVGVITLRRGLTTWRAVGLGLLAGLGAFTHARGLFLVPVAGIVLGAAVLVARPEWRRAATRAGLGLVALLVPLGLAFLYTRSHAGAAFGGGVDQAAGGGGSIRQLVSYVWQFYFPGTDLFDPKIGPDYGYRQVFIEGFFGDFGSLELSYSRTISTLLQDGAFIGLLLFAACLVRGPRVLVRQWRFLLVAGGSVFSMLALLHIITYKSLLTSPDPLITGRYLLPCVAVYGMTIAWVCAKIGRRPGQILGGALLGVFVLLQFGGLGLALERFYV